MVVDFSFLSLFSSLSPTLSFLMNSTEEDISELIKQEIISFYHSLLSLLGSHLQVNLQILRYELALDFDPFCYKMEFYLV